MTELQAEPVKKFLSAAEIVARALSGVGGLMAWCIDASYPADDSKEHPRVGRLYTLYTLEDGTWCKLKHNGAKSKELLALLDTHVLDAEMIEWATAYDDPPRDKDEKPFGIGPEGKQKLMAYRGRIWDTGCPPGAAKDPYEQCGMDEEIEAFSCNDVGSCCYYEKKDGVFEMVIG